MLYACDMILQTFESAVNLRKTSKVSVTESDLK